MLGGVNPSVINNLTYQKLYALFLKIYHQLDMDIPIIENPILLPDDGTFM